MSKVFYPKMATTNMKKNGKFYLPYILTCIFTIMMFYNMCSIASHQGLKLMKGADSIQSMMRFGSFVIGIFAVIFLFYTNNFLMRRRKKELGLYNILGMGKRHIAKVLFYETIFTGIISLVLGLGCGILFNQLVVLVMEKVFKLPVVLKTELRAGCFIETIILFFVIFFLCLLSNLAKIKLSNPIELLHGQNAGEKEPKTKWILSIIGFASLGIGYYIALTTESPLKALVLFFIAVILVIIGTYCLFTSGSIFILKLMRKNKKFFYKTKHFTSVSGMIYRMKQNAVGLANICILSTMVLVMLSGTISLYIGTEDALKYRYTSDFALEYRYEDDTENHTELIYSTMMKKFEDSKIDVVTHNEYSYLNFSAIRDGDSFKLRDNKYMNDYDMSIMVIFTIDEYNRMTNQNITLNENEVLICNSEESVPKQFTMLDRQYTIKQELDEFPYASEYVAFLASIHYVVVPSNQLQEIYEKQKEVYGKDASEYTYRMELDTTGTAEDRKEVYQELLPTASELSSNQLNRRLYFECRDDARVEIYNMYGGFLFLGCFLGALFIMATVLIIYYKQISEGYEDKERFSIMQKVGMSRAEVKKSIHSQVLMVFFLPIVMAAIHLLAAFKMISKLLALLNLYNVNLFAICTVGTVVVFGIIYAIVYALTAKVYSKIVES